MLNLKTVILNPCPFCEYSIHSDICKRQKGKCPSRTRYEYTKLQRDADQKVLDSVVEALKKIVDLDKRADGLRGQGVVDDVDLKVIRAMSKIARETINKVEVE